MSVQGLIQQAKEIHDIIEKFHSEVNENETNSSILNKLKRVDIGIYIIKYLSSHLYLVVLYQRIYIYNTSWLVTTKLLGIDFKNLFRKIHSTEVIMQILEIITSAIICMFFYLFIIVSLSKKILNFESIVNRINYVIE